MSKWSLTTAEILAGTGLLIISGGAAQPASVIPVAAIGAGAVYWARRSESVGNLLGSTPARFLLVDGEDSESTKLALPPKEQERRKKERTEKGSSQAGPFRFGWMNGIMSNISSQAQAQAQAEDVQKSAQAKEVNPEAAQASTEAPKAEKSAKKDSDAEWVAQASAGVPEGLELGKVASLRTVVEKLNKLVDDFPHLFVVGDSGAGKTTLVQLVVGTRPGKVVILDPKRPKGWEGPKWGGLPYVSRDKQSGSYKPMVAAMQQVVTEMNRRYRVQDEVTEPFEMLTVVLDEAKNSVEESEELAELYRKIVSIGREVNVRLILVSTTDRARKLGFDGEADSMDSFAWVVLGDMAVKTVADVKKRGDKKYHWALVSFAGGWVPFENEKAFDLLPSLNLRRTKAWAKPEYNCQTDTQAIRKAQDEWPEEKVQAHRNFAMRVAGVDADEGEPKGTRELQAIMLEDERQRPVVNGYVYSDEDIALLERLTGAGRSVKNKSDRSDAEVEDTSSAQGSALRSTSDAEIRTSAVQIDPVVLAENTLKTVPAVDQPKLGKALRLYATNGQKVTPAIVEGWGTGGGDKFSTRAEWLRAAHTVLLARQTRNK